MRRKKRMADKEGMTDEEFYAALDVLAIQLEKTEEKFSTLVEFVSENVSEIPSNVAKALEELTKSAEELDEALSELIDAGGQK
jgi:hypothetical protein